MRKRGSALPVKLPAIGILLGSKLLSYPNQSTTPLTHDLATAVMTSTATPTQPKQITLKWTFPTGDIVSSSPTVVNGVLYVGSDDKHVYALNANTGEFLYKRYLFLRRNLTWSVKFPHR